MELILTEDIEKLGRAGEIVRVRAGFGRNYLLPQGKALLATEGRLKDVEHKRRVIEEKLRKEIGELEAVARRIGETVLQFQRKAGEEGKLFGSVTSAEIHSRLQDQGVSFDRRKIELGESIRQLGEFDVEIRLHRQVSAHVKVKVVGEED